MAAQLNFCLALGGRDFEHGANEFHVVFGNHGGAGVAILCLLLGAMVDSVASCKCVDFGREMANVKNERFGVLSADRYWAENKR